MRALLSGACPFLAPPTQEAEVREFSLPVWVGPENQCTIIANNLNVNLCILQNVLQTKILSDVAIYVHNECERRTFTFSACEPQY